MKLLYIGILCVAIVGCSSQTNHEQLRIGVAACSALGLKTESVEHIVSNKSTMKFKVTCEGQITIYSPWPLRIKKEDNVNTL